MFTTIVVPLDGSELAGRAVGPAVATARALGARLVLMSAADEGEASERRRALEDRAAGLGDLVDRIEVVSDEAPADAIARVAGEQPGALVCMATHGRGGAGRALLGSVAEDVLAQLRDPVLLIGPHAAERAPAGAVAACLDGSEAAEVVLPLATDWARAVGSELRLVHVRHREISAVQDERDLEQGGAPDDDTVADLGSSYVEGLANVLQHRDVPARPDALHGTDPAAEIVDFARVEPVALLVLGTHGRTGLQRVRMGSVAMKVVHDAPCPALVIRTPGSAS